MVDALLRTRVPRWQELNRAIDERDDMLDFAMKLFHGDRDAAVTNYFQNALEQFWLVRHIASWRASKPRRMLDFASGYGRLTRLLVHEHLADAITVADILEGGMAFQAEQFSVQTILSRTDPAQFVAPETYDLIFVASLFTHLPPATFTTWLQRLASLLERDGLLIVSVHDRSLAPDKHVDGIAFESHSESRVLDVEEYGSTWVTEDYVRDQVAQLGENWACVRLPRALSDWQDVYVISPAPIANAQPRRVPKGFLEQPEMLAEGLRIWGWATTVDAPPDRIEVRIDDELVASTREFTHRGDVGEHFGVASAAQSGWECVVPHASVRSFRYQVATISAFSSSGEERILFLGTLDSLLGTVARERSLALGRQVAERNQQVSDLTYRLSVAEHERRTLEQQIAAMQQSRFWRARERWFAIKRGVGLTKER